MEVENLFPASMQYKLISRFYENIPSSTNVGTNPYTAQTRLSRKIYDFIKNHDLENQLISILIQKTKDLKKSLKSINFSIQDSNIYLVEISDPSKLEATINGLPTTSSDYVKIDQLASSEIIKSKQLPPDENSTISPGDYKFTIELDGETYEVDFSLPKDETYTNKDVLRMLSYEINMLDTNLTSDVYTIKKRSLNPKSPDSLIDYVYLKITNLDTGKDHYFLLNDTQGTLVKDLDLNTINNGAHNAKYEFNGTSKNTSENSVIEKNGTLNLTLIQESSKYISIKLNKNPKRISNNVLEIIDKYNNYIDWINKRDSVFKQQLLDSFYKIISNHFDKLNKIDLIPDKKGRLSPGDYFNTILNANLKDTISYLFGQNGFFSDIEKQLQTIIDSPDKFSLNKTELTLYSKYGTLEPSQKNSQNLNFYI